nr:immunoglobulin light chain junction region [Macaca mulatta]MOW08781.1 immunoglobulin light chain junction region [Macaca mulatta]MOW09221.1 immunoglobulin light chain junction region [Macaca mulatta]MOW09448.1 immunoglobulin light chain junction region [Macaca mulatta]MOW09639.1 immunoglobulin light chain junction region [Macaca mulatta]
CQQYNELPLTF